MITYTEREIVQEKTEMERREKQREIGALGYRPNTKHIENFLRKKARAALKDR